MGKITKNIKECYLILLLLNSKIPCTQHGQHDAIQGLDVSKAQEHHNIGLVANKSQLIVLDCDVDTQRNLNGIETLKKLESELGELPKTLTQLTPRGGKHFIFNDKGIINPIGKIGKDVDVKYRGYIVISPSKINGKEYKFIDGVNENEDWEISDLPEKWINYLNKESKSEIKKTEYNGKQYSRKLIDGDFQKIYNACSFIRYCVEQAAELDELSWFYFASVLNSLSNGKELFDLYSRPYPKYDKQETLKKFNNAEKYNVNCNTISKCFSGCSSCKYRNKED